MAGETKNRKSKIPIPGTVLVPGTGNRSSLVRGQSGGTIDVIVILLLLISNAVQNAMVGENTTLQGGLTAALALFVANFALKRLLFRNTHIRNWIEDEPHILIKDGKPDLHMLHKVEITLEEVLEVVREHGIERIEEVKLAVLEVDGNISVISLDHNQQTHYTHHKKRMRRQFRN